MQQTNFITDLTVFNGTRLNLLQQLRVFRFHARCSRLKAPLVSDAVAHFKLARHGIESVHKTLRGLESNAGIEFCRMRMEQRNIEGHVHGQKAKPNYEGIKPP
eukprot:229530-Amphidinium_carterae.2